MATLRPIVMGLAVSSILMLCAPRADSQQPLRYVDEHGVAHWVSSKEQIPQKYRDKAEAPNLPGVTTSGTPSPAEERQRRAVKESAEPKAETAAPPPAAPWAR